MENNDNLDLIESWKALGNQVDSVENIYHSGSSTQSLSIVKKDLRQLLFRRILETFTFSILTFLLVRFTIRAYPHIHIMGAGIILGFFTFSGFLSNIRVSILLLRLDYSAPVLSFQEKLEKIKVHNLMVLRLAFLSLPFYFTYMIIGAYILFGIDLMAEGNPAWLWTNLLISFLFLWPAVWLYRNLSYKTQIPWIRTIIQENGGSHLRSAFRFFGELEQFKTGS